MNKGVTIFIVICLVLSAMVAVLSPATLYLGFNEGSQKSLTYLLISLGVLFISGLVYFMESKYPEEYKKAFKISYMPYNKYGVYALVGAIAIFAAMFAYAYLSSPRMFG